MGFSKECKILGEKLGWMGTLICTYRNSLSGLQCKRQEERGKRKEDRSEVEEKQRNIVALVLWFQSICAKKR